MNEAREQLLISRVIDDPAAEPAWRELESLAETDTGVWKQVALAQRDHADLCRAMAGAAAVADRVELPAVHRPAVSTHHSSTHLRLNRLGAWTGWAVAALVTIVASGQFAQPWRFDGPLPVDPSHHAGPSIQSAADAFKAYLEKGRESGEVVGEIPAKLLVDTKPAQSGGYEVIFVRQVMERAIVPDLYRFSGQDETGRPTLVRYQVQVQNSM